MCWHPYWFPSPSADPLREGIGIVQTVAKGELGVEISKKLLTRKDEVGDLSQSIYTLQKELKHILKQIAEERRN